MNTELIQKFDAIRGLDIRSKEDLARALQEQGCIYSSKDHEQWLEFMHVVIPHEFEMANVPSWLVKCFCELMNGKSVNQACDPWPGLGFLASKVAQHCGAEETVVISKNPSDKVLGEYLFPKLRWEAGDSLDFLAGGNGNYDLSLGVLPFGIMGRTGLSVKSTDGKETQLHDLLGHQIIALAAQNLITNTGLGLFVVTPPFFSSNKSILSKFEEIGLGLVAALDLPAGTFAPYTNIKTTLIAVKKGAVEKRFVAKLSPDEIRNSEVIENFLAEKDGFTPDMGSFVDPAAYNCFSTFYADTLAQANEVKFGGSSFKIGEISTSISLGRVGDEFAFEDRANAIYVPMLGNSDVKEKLDDLHLKPQNYAQIVINSDLSDPRFIVRFLNSEIGKEQLEIRKSGTIPRLNLRTLSEVPVCAPSQEQQQKILEIDQKVVKQTNTILALQNEIQELRRELWSNPAQAEVVESKTEALGALLDGEIKSHASSSMEQWIESLPFPLSSILRSWQATTSQDYKTKYELLIHFFEATVEFTGIIFLSAFQSDPGSFAEHRRKINIALDKTNIGFARASFGTWKVVVEYFGKQTRILLNDNGKSADKVEQDRKLCAEIFADSTLKLPKVLSKIKLAEILSTTGGMRNWKSHGGLVSPKVAEARNEVLLSEVQKLREVLEDVWADIELLNPISCIPKPGHFENEVSILRGSNPEFLKKTCVLRTFLVIDSLYFLCNGSKEVLKLLPLVQVGSAPESVKNACYFFSSLAPDGAKFVSYHFADLPERVDSFVSARETIQQLIDPQ